MTAIVPLRLGERVRDGIEAGSLAQVANEFADPYQVPDFNFGWSATDACCSFGSYDLASDEALVVTHRPPDAGSGTSTSGTSSWPAIPRRTG